MDAGEPLSRRLWRRARTQAALKASGLTAGCTAFFIAYFHLLSHPRTTPWVVPALAPDDWLPFSAAWIVPYFSLWVYVSLFPGLLTGGQALLRYAAASTGLAAAGLVIFYLWPSRLVPVEIDWSLHPGVGFLKRIDAAGNVCPSLHVAFAVFTAAGLARVLREERAPGWLRATNLAWATMIVLSTLGTKQHVILDVLAGILLGSAFALLHRPPGVSRLQGRTRS